MSTFQKFFQISLNIFEKFDLDNLVLKKSILAKKKDISKRKKTLRSIQSKLKVVKKKKRRKF